MELLVIGFPGNKFKGEILPEMQELMDKKLIKVNDFVFITKNPKGAFEAVEVENFDKTTTEFFHKLGIEPSHIISEEDITKIGMALKNDSSAAILLFEHVWIKKFRDAIVRADGVLIRDDRLPAGMIEEALKFVEKEHKRPKKIAAPKKK
jgi:hypothetical protein